MDSTVHELSALVPPPQCLPFRDSYVLRHVERLPKQAIVQKLSRLPSGLRGAVTLCSAGLFQEQAALHRIVDEIGEDIFFLSIPIIQGKEFTEAHRQYLDAFFQEDFDATSGKPILDGKPMVPRKKIRAYNANAGGGTSDPSGAIQAGRSVHKTDSGYVHASSPHIMDSYGGNPPRFHTTGMLGTIRESEYRQHLDNYFYRTITAFAIAATAFGIRRIFCEMQAYMHAFTVVLEGHRYEP